MPDNSKLHSEIRELVKGGRGFPVPIIALTDEEISALDSRPDEAPSTPQPWLSGQADSDKSIIRQVALRGLIARKIIVPIRSEAGNGNLIAVNSKLRIALEMRCSPESIMLAQRRSSAHCWTRMLYLHPQEEVLEEDISPGGLHQLTVTSAEDAVERLASFADPANAANEFAAADPVIGTVAQIADGSVLPPRGARWSTAIGRLSRGPSGESSERRLTVFALPDRVMVTEACVASGEAALAFSEVTPSGLRERITILLRASHGRQDSE